jgi:adenylate cyclase
LSAGRPGEQEFAAAGLLDGLDDEDRAGRLELLAWLAERGASLDQLREAVAADRLALLPADLLLSEGCRYDLAEAAERAGLDPELFAAIRLAAGLSVPPPGTPAFSDDDVAGWSLVPKVLATGLPPERYVELTRVAGRGAGALAEALLETFADTALRPGDTETEVALRLAQLGELLVPMLGPLMEAVVSQHLREAIRRRALDREAVASGELRHTGEMTVAFADFVDFTRYSENVGVEGVGALATRLEALVGEVVQAPVRLVKLIGDAAMLAAPDAPPVVEACRRLVQAAAADDELPELRAGVATGVVAMRAGDCYGPSVNLASRLTGVGRPGAVIASEAVVEAAGDGFSWRAGEPRELKGIAQPVTPYELA